MNHHLANKVLLFALKFFKSVQNTSLLFYAWGNVLVKTVAHYGLHSQTLIYKVKQRGKRIQNSGHISINLAFISNVPEVDQEACWRSEATTRNML